MAQPAPIGFQMRAKRAIDYILGDPFLKIVFPFLLLAGIFLVVTPVAWYGKWFSPRITGLGTLIDAAIIIFPNFVFLVDRNANIETLSRKHRALTRLQNYIAVVVLLALSGAAGLFGLYHYWSYLQYDKLLHFINPLLLTIGLSEFIYHWYDIPLSRALAIAAISLAILNIGWEFTEYLNDKLFGTMLFGQDGQNVVWDTAMDVSLDFLSILIAVLIVKRRAKQFITAEH